MNPPLAPGATRGELACGLCWPVSLGGNSGSLRLRPLRPRAADVASRMAGLFFLLCLQTFTLLLQWRVASFLRCDFFFPRLQPESPFDVLSPVVRPDVWPERM